MHNRELACKRVGVCLSVQTLSVCMFVPSVCLSVSLSTSFNCLSVCPVYLSVCVLNVLSVYLFVCLSFSYFWLSVSSICLFVLSVIPICLSVYSICLYFVCEDLHWRLNIILSQRNMVSRFLNSSYIIAEVLILSNLTLNLVKGELKTHAIKKI